MALHCAAALSLRLPQYAAKGRRRELAGYKADGASIRERGSCPGPAANTQLPNPAAGSSAWSSGVVTEVRYVGLPDPLTPPPLPKPGQQALPARPQRSGRGSEGWMCLAGRINTGTR
mmetsp:Transcript_11214/g.31795  ORF Transcript_11214/g.31795 Transcript_11214/m.31795 type:complete len:117 (+) Transcript_11214:207-557(+)